MPVRSRLAISVLVAAVGLATAACQVDVEVGLDVGGRGSGRVEVAVTLDADAARRLPAGADAPALEDLRRRGWTVTGPGAGDGGGTVVRAAKAFASPGEARAVLAEVSGEEGPLRDLTLEREGSFLRTSYRFAGTADLTSGIEAFSDDSLRRQLDGADLTAALERLVGATAEGNLRVRVVADLPGQVSADAPGAVDGAPAWELEPGEAVDLAATSTTVNVARAGWATASVIFAALLVILSGRRVWRRARPRAPA
ncbi:MAG: hypothetical protein ACRDZ9_03425 [Acidimicrobiales bacterium]